MSAYYYLNYSVFLINSKKNLNFWKYLYSINYFNNFFEKLLKNKL